MEAPQDLRTAIECSASGPYVRWSFNPQGILDPTREDSRLVISLIMLRLAAIIDEEEQLSRNRGPRKKKPSFLRRPVPMWAFLLLVVILVIVIFLPAFLPISTVTISQPLVLTSNNQTLSISPGEITTANFTVANLNSTSVISTTPTITLAPASSHIVLMISGVETGRVFTNSTDGKTVSFQPGGNTLVIRATADLTTLAGNYTVHVSLTG